MDISAISSIPVTPSLAVSSTRPVSFLFFTPAISDVTSVETVDISALGRLLSAVSIFESTATSQASFSTVLAGAQFLVDAFNEFLQSDSLQSPLGGSLGNLFVRMLEAQTAGASESGESVLASLSRIGINFLPSESLSGSGSIAIDLETIQAAFNTDPSGPVGVLTQAGRAIARAASEFTNLFLRTADLTQSSQGLLDTDLLGGALATSVTAATVATVAAALPGAEAAAATALTGETVTATAGATLPSAAATSPTDTAALEELVAATLAAAKAGAAARATVGEAGTITPSALPPAAAATVGVESAPAAELPAAATTAPATPATPSAAVPAPTAATVATATTATNEPVAAPPAEEIVAATTLPLPATAGAAETAPPATAATTTPAGRAAPATLAAPAPLRAPGTLAAEEAAAALLTGRAAAVAAPSAAPAAAVAAVPAPLQPSPDLTVDASNPAVAAAIAAYHVIDGIFDSSKAGSERTKATFPGYSDIRPVVPVRPGRLDLHA